jgi:hypothetical protein
MSPTIQQEAAWGHQGGREQDGPGPMKCSPSSGSCSNPKSHGQVPDGLQHPPPRANSNLTIFPPLRDVVIHMQGLPRGQGVLAMP